MAGKKGKDGEKEGRGMGRERGRGRGGEDGREREGIEERRGKVTEGMGGTRQDVGWDGEERERRKGREREERGYRPKLQFLAPPLSFSLQV